MTVQNAYTKIETEQTILEISRLLAKHGAEEIRTRYVQKKPVGLSFQIATRFGAQSFALPVLAGPVHKALVADYGRGAIDRRCTTPEHAERVAWRIAKDWLQSQLTLVDLGMRDLAAVLLADLELGPGVTLYQAIAERKTTLPALPAGRG